MRDESFINPHFVIRDAGSSSGLQASRLPLLRLEVGSSKGRCRQPTCYSCAGYNRTHTAAAGHFTFGKKRRSRFFPKAGGDLAPLRASVVRLWRTIRRTLRAESFSKTHVLGKQMKFFAACGRQTLAEGFVPAESTRKHDENIHIRNSLPVWAGRIGGR